MGTNTTKLSITDTIDYEGQTRENVPQGKGRLSIYAKQDGQARKKIWNVQGQFFKGEISGCVARREGMEYRGEVRRGTFSGNGRTVDQELGIESEGLFEDGVLAQGKVIKRGCYQCKGNFVQDEKGEEGSNKQNGQSKTKFLLLNGPNAQCNCIKNYFSIKANFVNGEANGEGSYKFPNGDLYNGQFKDTHLEKYGQYFSPNSQLKLLKGNFHKSQPHTSKTGSQTAHEAHFRNGDTYSGPFRHGKMHGKKGVYTFRDGTVYAGSFQHGNLTGDCEIVYGHGGEVQSYKGEILEGKFNGHGVLVYRNGIILKAYFERGIKNGPCTYSNGQRTWKCLYINDELKQPLTQLPLQPQCPRKP